MKRAILKLLFTILLFILLIVPHCLHFFATGDIQKILSDGAWAHIALDSLGYYATCFGLIFTVFAYFKKQKERDEDLKAERKDRNEKIQSIERENIQLRKKEIESRKDNFRPSFVLNKDMTRIIVIMKNSDFYLDNVCYYKTNDSNGTYLGCLKHNDEIELEGSNNNYFITGETLIGEQFIFGVILNKVKVYKALKEGSNPLTPNDFTHDDIAQKIENNWISFNRVETIPGIDYSNEQKNYIEIDTNFMYKTVGIRANMVLNLTNHMFEIMNQDDVKKVFCRTLHTLSADKKDYKDCVRYAVIEKLQEILLENIDTIEINLNNMSNRIEYIESKGGNTDIFKENKTIPTICAVNECIGDDQNNIEDTISIFLCIIENSDFKKEINEKLSYIKVKILSCIEN